MAESVDCRPSLGRRPVYGPGVDRLPLLREVDRRLGLLDALNAAIFDPRCPWLIEHDQRTILAQRVFALAAGYEDLNDHQALRHDTLFQALTDRVLKAGQTETDALSSPSTLCRLENRITRGDLARLAAVHGRQEGRFFHGYYDHYCFLPLYVTCGQQLLVAYLRPANLDGEAQTLYDDLYCQRGEAENRIKDQQLGCFADRTSCHDFLSNQFRVLLSAAAYVLVETLRRVGLAGTELAAAQVGTIRLKLLKIGGRIVRSVRRLVIHLASGYPLQRTFQTILERLQEWRCRPTRVP